MTCQHNNEQLTLTPELTHYGKVLCGTCGRFIRWEKKPETVEKMIENADKLAFLRDRKLPEWEAGFILSLEKTGRPSPKQQAKLDEIADRYGYGPAIP